MAGKVSPKKLHPGLLMKRPKRKMILDPLCYLKFAITNSFNMKQRQRGGKEEELLFRLRREGVSRKKPVQNSSSASKTGQDSNQLPHRKVDQLKKELKAVLKTSAAKLSSAQLKRKISNLERRMESKSPKLRPKFEIRDCRRIDL